MKQELFKGMYNEIKLNREQKDKIWYNLEAGQARGYTGAGKRFHTPAFAAVCVCVILVIGMPVLAANTSVVQSIINAFNTLAGTEQELTEEQKDIYAKYGSALDNEIVLGNGTLKLEAIINDGHNICIPFSMHINKGGFSGRILDEIADLNFYVKNNKYVSFGQITSLDSKQQKNKVKTGCYLLYSYESVIKQGDVLQVKSNRKREEMEKEKAGETLGNIEAHIPVISEITINAPTERWDIPANAIQKKLAGTGISVDKIQLSPISFTIEGVVQKSDADKSVTDLEPELVLKDGSTVKKTSSGFGSSISNLDKEHDSYTIEILFEAPVNPADVAKIHIKNASLDLWIPVAGCK